MPAEWPLVVKYAIGKVLTGIGSRITDQALKSVATLPLPWRWSIHRKEVEAKVKDMPFIYKDLTSEVLNDFVELDLRALDLDSLKEQKHLVVQSSVAEKLQRHRKAVLLGNAGMGKTTFLRYTILNLISNHGVLAPYFGGERL